MHNESFSLEQLRLLNRIASYLTNALDPSESLTTVLHWLSNECDMNRGVISISNSKGTGVYADITVSHLSSSQTDKMRYESGEGITGQVFESGEAVFMPMEDPDGNLLYRSGIREELDISKLAFICVPVTYHKNVIGTLSIDKALSKVKNQNLEMDYLDEIASQIAPFLQRRALEEKMELFHTANQVGGSFSKMIGKSTQINEIKKLIIRIIDVRTTILITGETGVGKGIIAELIHNLGPNKKKPFVEVNCGAIPENLIESELFGHEKGAFTGAIVRRIGVIERAKGGTVFLDEIGELPLNAQIKLLRVLQNREFERVGGTETIRSSARIISATNRELEKMIINGDFRSDLYYRLNVFPIHVPSLRERGASDIMLLVNHFIQRSAEDLGKNVTRIDTPAIDMLTSYHWPGNVRELENVIERAVLLADDDAIHGHHLPPTLQMNRYSEQKKLSGNFNLQVKNFEIELITEALKDAYGSQAGAARNLGITKRIIQYKISKYEIDYQRFKNSNNHYNN